MKKIGLSGAHRTGKTTIAKELSVRTGQIFCPTNAGNIFLGNGIKPNTQDLNFFSRLDIQWQILLEFEKKWGNAGENFVTDRTPLDLIAYTLISAPPKIKESELLGLDIYKKNCLEALNYFDIIFIIPPVIPMRYEDNKGVMDINYINELHSIIQGISLICSNQHLKIIEIDRNYITIESRIAFILESIFSYRFPS